MNRRWSLIVLVFGGLLLLPLVLTIQQGEPVSTVLVIVATAIGCDLIASAVLGLKAKRKR